MIARQCCGAVALTTKLFDSTLSSPLCLVPVSLSLSLSISQSLSLSRSLFSFLSQSLSLSLSVSAENESSQLLSDSSFCKTDIPSNWHSPYIKTLNRFHQTKPIPACTYKHVAVSTLFDSGISGLRLLQKDFLLIDRKILGENQKKTRPKQTQAIPHTNTCFRFRGASTKISSGFTA